MGKDYLVEGAVLMCINGSKKSWLKIPEGHGYTSDGRKKANCMDCTECKNISYFGECKKNTDNHKCEGFMKLDTKWRYTGGTSVRLEKVDNEDAITMDSVLICKRGGLIIPVSSGQGYEKKINWDAFKKRFQNIMLWALGKQLICHIFGGDPINLNTGNYIYEKEDLVISGITTLSFRIFYNSMEKGLGGCIGEGWHHNYEMSVREEKGGFLKVCLHDGRELPYRRMIGDVYVPVFGDCGLLKKEESGFRYIVDDGIEYKFDVEGRLCLKKDRYGNMDVFTYNSIGQLIKVSGANGGELFYTYNREGSLIRVKDHTGRKVELWYKYRKLWKFINASGYAYVYDYNANGKLESIVTPRGIRSVYNEYDAADRVVKQIMADGSVIELLYDDENMRTYMKTENGNMVIHESDERFRNIKNVYEDGEELFEYNEKNQKTLYEDKKGNRTRYHYNNIGKIARTKNALGHVTEFTYDDDGKLINYKKPGSTGISYSYNHMGKLTKVTDTLGRSHETVYNQKGLPEYIIQPDGSTIHLVYDNRGNLTSIINPYGSITAYEYDDLNRLKSITDAEGGMVCYQYDALNHLTAITDPEGNSRTYIYNESGMPVCIRDFDGKEMTIKYNCMNKPEQVTDKDGRVTMRRYDKMGNLAEEIAPSGTVTCYFYNKNKRVERVEIKKSEADEEKAIVFNYEYDRMGNLLRSAAGDGKEILSESTYVYDALDRIVEVTEPAGGKRIYTYDEGGHVSCIIDPAGNKRCFNYDEEGQLTKKTDIRGNTTCYTYNSLGKINTIVDGVGRKTVYQYLSGGRLEHKIYPDGRRIHYTYDRLGRIKTKTDAEGYCLTYHYDKMGRILKVESNAGQEKSYSYDVLGNITSVTDANGNSTYYDYSSNGKITTVTDALGHRTEFVYDVMDRMIHISQYGEKGEKIRESFYERDSLGRAECIRDALGNEEYFQYDALGRNTVKTDKDGYKTLYTYEPDGKVKDILYDDGTRVELEYTALRQLSKVHDWFGDTEIERNQQGDPIRIVDYMGRNINYEWGEMGERRSITYPDGKKVRYKYDVLLRLKELVKEDPEEENIRIEYYYDSIGRLAKKQMPGNICTKWKYNKLGLLEELVHLKGEDILDCYRYGYDAMGNKISVEKERRGLLQESGTYKFEYDVLNRLTSVEKEGILQKEYVYDSFGNRMAKNDYRKQERTVYEYDAKNRMIKETLTEENDGLFMPTAVKTYDYDLRGNLIAEYQNGNLLHSYKYNAMNRLERVRDENGLEVLYHYNGLGQRVGRKMKNVEEDYLLDLTRPYHNLLEIRKEENRQTFYWDLNIAVMEADGRKPCYYLNDEFGSPLRVLYSTGKGEVYGYDEFGNDLYELGADLQTSYTGQGIDQPFGYAGYCYDNISGTYFAQAREYMPNKGRFAAEDIIRGNGAVPKTLNRYAYCLGNPMCFIDWDGLFPAWLNGIYAHIQFEAEFMAMYGCVEGEYIGTFAEENYYGEVNVYIPNGGINGGKGLADLIMHDNDNANIYEIKPQSHYEDSKKRKEGEKQLGRYISNYKGNDQALEGTQIYVEPLLYIEEPFLFESDRTIIYRMYSDSPGMIYYELSGGDEEPETVTVLEYKKQKAKRMSKGYEIAEAVVALSIVTEIGKTAGTMALEASGFFPVLIMDEEWLEIILQQIKERLTGQSNYMV